MSTFNQDTLTGSADQDTAKADESTETTTEQSTDTEGQDPVPSTEEEAEEAAAADTEQSTDTAEEVEQHVEEALASSPAHGSQAAAINGLQTDAGGHDSSKL